jgi:adenosylcobinamide kinase / adenosylcobinamide-phosphate guanylyltransferase
MITVVLGGARSGKSRAAERLAEALPAPVTYFAPATVRDDDHAARVAAHRARRDPSWTTVETGAALVPALRSVPGSALVDSLGSWIAEHDGFTADVSGLCAALLERNGDTVVVCEEVGLGVHPATEVGRRFRDAVGAANAAVAEVAEHVWLVVAGRLLRLDRP